MTLVTELDTVCEHFERYRAVSLQALDLVPDDKVDWQPVGGLRSIQEIDSHPGPLPPGVRPDKRPPAPRVGEQ